ncbi:acylphosphatase [Mucilaginibacter sp.]|uniref:acylphosphatase n=1 Tax=Mucilaginibacter sp. TaxID=1882438 RepID=UPI002629DEF0|nr:acylphosphatase [Mucilaginibacter sp.]MDB4925742.1 acylphosphatase [Mucilaginibacter sp.]MDB5030914.1 acylphosphatase [Mucilaginibacter sp.]
MKHFDITVKGKVQGVFYRASTKAVADQLGVRGTIKNEANGDVVIEAEGEPAMIEMFLEWCREGPQGAEVTTVESNEGELKNYRNFEVLKRGLFK